MLNQTNFFLLNPGKGSQFWKKNGALYDGDWKNNKRCGFGTLSIPGEDGDYKRVYAGGWKADKRHVTIANIII